MAGEDSAANRKSLLAEAFSEEVAGRAVPASVCGVTKLGREVSPPE